MKPKLIVLFALFTVTAAAQKTEVGGFAGVGTFVAEDVRSRTFWVAGVESCLFCNGRFALFAEYNRYGNTGDTFGETIKSVDLVNAGLRIQKRRGRVRPFFDIGVSGGRDTFQRSFGPRVDQTHGIIGAALGGGATISMGERWYVRPAVRFQALRGLHFGASVAASVGYRF